jgi:hypothetical protein
MALISDLGVDGDGIYQPMLKYRWRLNFLGFGGDPDPMRVNAITCERPKVEFEEVQIDRYNSTAYVAGKHRFQPMNITVDSDVGGLVSKAIQDQVNLQQSIIGNFPAPRLPAAIGGAIYKFAIRQEMLDGDDGVLEAWIVEGCWIQSYDGGELDYGAAGEKLSYSLTIRYDHARQVITGTKVNATGGAGI